LVIFIHPKEESGIYNNSKASWVSPEESNGNIQTGRRLSETEDLSYFSCMDTGQQQTATAVVTGGPEEVG